MGQSRSGLGLSRIEEASRSGRVDLERVLSETRTEMAGMRVGMEQARLNRNRGRYEYFAREYVHLSKRERQYLQALSRVKSTFSSIESAAIANHSLQLQKHAIGIAKDLTSSTRRTVKNTLEGVKTFDELGQVTSLADDATADVADAARDTTRDVLVDTGANEEDAEVRHLMQEFDGVPIEDLPHVPTDPPLDLETRLENLKAQP